MKIKYLVLKKIFLLICLIIGNDLVLAKTKTDGTSSFSEIRNSTSSIDVRINKATNELAEHLKKLEEKLKNNTRKTEIIDKKINKISTQIGQINANLSVIEITLKEATTGLKLCVNRHNKELTRAKKQKDNYLTKKQYEVEKVIKHYNKLVNKADERYKNCLNENSQTYTQLRELDKQLNKILEDIELSDNDLESLKADKDYLLEDAKHIQNLIDDLKGKNKSKGL